MAIASRAFIVFGSGTDVGRMLVMSVSSSYADQFDNRQGGDVAGEGHFSRVILL